MGIQDGRRGATGGIMDRIKVKVWDLNLQG
jgi:hypothetical protein